MTIFTDLISNVALLLALSILYSFLTRIWQHREITGQIVAGILFGSVAVAGMIYPFDFAPGVIFDGRSMLVSMAGLFGGPVTAAITTLIAGAYRLGLGGTGALTGFGVIFTSAAFGVAYYYLRRIRPDVIRPLYLFGFGVIVHVSMLLWMLTLPWPLAFVVLDEIWLPVMLIFPLGTLFLGTLLADQEERNYAQDALRESEEKFRDLYDNAPSAYFSISASDGSILRCNSAAVNLLGYDKETIMGMKALDLYADTPQGKLKAQGFFKHFKKGEPIQDEELQMKHRSGDPIEVSLSVEPIRDRDGKVIESRSVVMNISERKKGEEALRKSEEKYRLLADNVSDNIWMLDLGTLSFSYVSPSVVGITGYSAEEATGLQLQDTLTPSSMKLATEMLSEELSRESRNADPSRSRTLELEQYRKDGTTVWTEVSVRFIRNTEGRPSSILGVTRDITERKQAEEALQESEGKFKQLFDLSPLAVALTDVETGKLTDVNESFCNFCNYSKDDLLGRTTTEVGFFSREWRDRFTKELQAMGEIHGLEMDYKTKDGSIHPALVFSKVIQLAGETSILTALLDVTEQKSLQDQLHRAQKMEAMGLMAGGVAHDLNNILSGIVSYPELLLMDLPEDSPLRKPIKTIQESGMRAADVVEDLLTIARGVASGKEVLNFNTLITEYLGSAEYQKLEKTHSFVSCRTELDPDLLNMSGSSTHIKKILMNLVANASEAIEGSGTVTISTTNRYLDEPLKGYEDVNTGEYVLLTVSDDGSGISSEDLERIFEPFYTKKIMGRSGTGLGLAVVWNCMQDHDGYINVKSSEKGTVFELYFPVTREEVAAKKEEVPLDDYLGHGEKILVVDDEERQREIASGILTKLGYNAEVISSGEEAIEYVKENPVDLIVLDMVMPKGINGRETYEQIIKFRPGQKAIIATGYAKTKEVDKAQALGAGKYIKKPYTLAKVGLAVKEELEKQVVLDHQLD